MTRLLLASTLGAIVALLAAQELGGAVGSGVLAGFFLGAALSGLGMLYQRHVLLTQPERIMLAVASTFLLTLVTLLLGGVAFRYVDVLAQRVDWRGFLIAFAAAAAVILPLGAMEASRAYRQNLQAQKLQEREA